MPVNRMKSQFCYIMIDKLKKIMMVVSLLFIILCLGASLWMALSLPSGDPNVMTFYLMAFVFLAGAIWFGLNVYNLFKSDK